MYDWSSKNQANFLINVQLANRYVIQEEKGISVFKKWSNTLIRPSICLLCWSWNKMYWGETGRRVIDMAVDKVASIEQTPRKRRKVWMVSGQQQRSRCGLPGCQRRTPASTASHLIFLRWYSCLASYQLSWPNKCSKSPYIWNIDQRCHLGENWRSASLSRSRFDIAKYDGAKARDINPRSNGFEKAEPEK